MSELNEYLAHARSLQREILGAPEVWLPRRAVLLEWLENFLRQAAAPGFRPPGVDAANLDALDHFLRQQHIPAGVP